MAGPWGIRPGVQVGASRRGGHQLASANLARKRLRSITEHVLSKHLGFPRRQSRSEHEGRAERPRLRFRACQSSAC